LRAWPCVSSQRSWWDGHVSAIRLTAIHERLTFLTLCGRSYSFEKLCAFLQRQIFEIIAMEVEHTRQNYNKVKQGTFSLEYIFCPLFELSLSFLLSP
jgi:hypothetical protein